MSSIIAGIVAHKFILAIALSALAVTGGAVVVVSNSHGTLAQASFSITSPVQVISMASLNLGSLSPGQSVTMSTSAKVNLTSSGNYTLFLSGRGILNEVFSNFMVRISGFSSPVSLNLTNQQQTVKLGSGVYSVSVSVAATVQTSFGHSITVTNLSFLGMTYGNHAHPLPSPEATDNEDDNNED